MVSGDSQLAYAVDSAQIYADGPEWPHWLAPKSIVEF